MRVRLVVGSALALFLGVACSAVPDLRFGDAQDAGGTVLIDSSLATPAPTGSPGVDAAPSTGEDAASPQDASTPDANDASASSADGAAPMCPGNPPKNAQCCGAVVCRPGGANYCDCNSCQQHCATQGFCCMNKFGMYQGCAITLQGCPPP